MPNITSEEKRNRGQSNGNSHNGEESRCDQYKTGEFKAVKWGDRGYGFLKNPHGKNIFVHVKAFKGTKLTRLIVGERYEADYVESDKGTGLMALKVRPLHEPANV